MKRLDREAALKMFSSERRRERQRRQRQRIVSCCKKLAAFLFSHIGLAGMVVAYSIMGGFLFRALEAPFEQRVKLSVVGLRERMVDEIWRLASDVADARVRQPRRSLQGTTRPGSREAGERQNFTARVHDILRSFQREVRAAVKDQGWDGNDDMDEARLQWSYAGALLYAVTVTTTIGQQLCHDSIALLAKLAPSTPAVPNPCCSKSVQRHTGLTHCFYFLTFGRSGAHS